MKHNPLDEGAIRYNPAAPIQQTRLDGLHNRNVLRAMLASGWGRWYWPEPLWVEHDEAVPAGNEWKAPGPWLWSNIDLEIEGDDETASTMLFNSTSGYLNGIRIQHPRSLRLERFGMECMRLTASLAEPLTACVFVPGKGGNPTAPHKVELSRVRTRNGRYGVVADAGPTNSANRFTIDAERLDVVAEGFAVACHNDVRNGGGKSVHLKEFRLGTTKGPISSHVMYVAATCNIRMRDGALHSWRSQDYGLQHWGAGVPGHRADYVDLESVVWEETGDGYAGITTPIGETNISRSLVKCRTGFQCRGKTSFDRVKFNHRPVMDGTITSISTLGPSTIAVRGFDADLSDLGTRACTIFDLQSSDGRIDIDGADIVSRAPVSATCFASAAAAGGPGKITAKNVVSFGYQVPDAEYAMGVRAELNVGNMAQGFLELADSTFTGDMSRDRGGLRLIHDGFKKATLHNVLIKPTRGLALYATKGGQLDGVAILDGGIQQVGGVTQSLDLPLGAQASATIAGDALVVSTSTNRYLLGAVVPERALVNGQIDDTACYVGSLLEVAFGVDAAFAPLPNMVLPMALPAGTMIPLSTAVRPAGSVALFRLSEQLHWRETAQ